MTGRPPLRLEVVTVLAGPAMMSAAHKAAAGRGRMGWRSAKLVPDLWAKR